MSKGVARKCLLQELLDPLRYLICYDLVNETSSSERIHKLLKLVLLKLWSLKGILVCILAYIYHELIESGEFHELSVLFQL